MQQAQSNENTNSSDMKTEDSSNNIPLELREDFDHRYYRPLEVDVSIIMHDIQAHLLKVYSIFYDKIFIKSSILELYRKRSSLFCYPCGKIWL